jgi:hypothetical protein
MKTILPLCYLLKSKYKLFRHSALIILLILRWPAVLFSQCPGGYTQAQLNWDHLDYYFNSGVNIAPYGHSTGNYITNAWEQTQKFAIGSNYLTIAVSAAGIVKGDTAIHTGDIPFFTGNDAQFTPTANGQTITITFNNPVINPSFTLYDVDGASQVNFGAVNALAVPLPVNMALQAGSTLLPFNNNTPFAYVTSGAANDANNLNTSTVTVSVLPAAGPVKQMTITLTTIGTDPNLWLSDILACVTGSFPTNYNQTGNNQPMTGPAGNQPDYFIITPDNQSVYMVDPVTGQARWLFTDASNTYVNSFAYDPYNHIFYYVTDGSVANPQNNKTLKKYDFNTEVISTVVADIGVTLGIPTFNQGVESAAAAFYDGSLYLGIEGGKFDLTGTVNDWTRETIFWRIDFDAFLNPVNAYQVFSSNSFLNNSNTSIHDFGDFIIKNGTLYDFNTARNGTNYSQSKYHHYNLMTGNVVALYNNPGTTSWNGQAGMTWTGGLYYFRSTGSPNSGIGLYDEAGNNAAPINITVVGGGPAWPGGAGDASENFRPKCDFGDAPASYDPVLISPAVHERFDSLRFGLTWDREWVKTSSAGANADGGDEDGIATVNLLDTATTNYTADISVYNNSGADATVGGWLDIDGDGVFEASEYASAIVISSASQQNITLSWLGINTPLLAGQSTYLRIRITAAAKGMGANNATGYYDIGEVEDYRVLIASLLPVDLISFEAKAINKKSVRISWSVTGEADMNGYEVQRSANSYTWSPAGFVQARNQNGVQEYSIADNAPLSGKSYYRLKMLENNGVYKYSKVETVVINTAAIDIIVYPNPVTDQSVIKINADQFLETTVKMFNGSGLELSSQKMMIHPGENKIPLTSDNLPPGIYTLYITMPMETKTVRFVKK